VSRDQPKVRWTFGPDERRNERAARREAGPCQQSRTDHLIVPAPHKKNPACAGFFSSVDWEADTVTA